MRSKAGVLLITASLVLFVAILFIVGCAEQSKEIVHTSVRPVNENKYPPEMTFPENWKALKPSQETVRVRPTFEENRTETLTKQIRESAVKIDQETDSVDIGIFNADEVWVIVKADKPAPPDDDYPTCGSLITEDPRSKKQIALPLKHTDVNAGVSGYISTVNVKQEFINPYDIKIEAKYVFPLPQDAAVNDFLMTIGNRTIRGIIREKEQAKRIYDRAKSQGHVASLLTQQRPNIFTQQVANIEPGRQIDIDIQYINTLKYVDGWYEFVFPMVVGPRYNPAGYKKGITAGAHGTYNTTGQPTEVKYLSPDEESMHDISLSLDIHAGVAVEDYECRTHRVECSRPRQDQLNVMLSKYDDIPNKDFVFRFRVAGDKIKSSLVTHSHNGEKFFSLMIYPPAGIEYIERQPVEMVFVLDCSGSMSGKPIEIAKESARRALKKLRPYDTFQVIRFSNTASKLGTRPVYATPANIQKGLRYLDSLKGSGGTEMIKGIEAALKYDHHPNRSRIVTFMTDGYIGNEEQILKAIKKDIRSTRIFSFGVGSSVNRYLLDRMAGFGNGAVAYIGLNDDCYQVIDSFYDRISHPALTDIDIDFGSMKVRDVYPSRIPDLFVGRPVLITGKFTGQYLNEIYMTGQVKGEKWRTHIPPCPPSGYSEVIPSIWARKKIEDLANRSHYEFNPFFAGEIKNTALKYNLMSQYTSFLAVDSMSKTYGDHGYTVDVPVPVPAGVKYDTTVGQY